MITTAGYGDNRHPLTRPTQADERQEPQQATKLEIYIPRKPENFL
ncbi:hypothetical protein ARZXY2_4962 (plasmid) [Arthrobacter sp. ZXY-2]|nr:hypothetical protein ARZXY2_4959 [Arthrobacter sp. ZXY-2]AOY74461.1 hypothetical protein ARZXY2_4962 [Arthrobacter sp. ZXY-2]